MGGHILDIDNKDDLLALIRERRPALETTLQGLLEELTRNQQWEDLSPPLRARWLGLIQGDGSVSPSAVTIKLQVNTSTHFCFHRTRVH